MNNKVLTVFDGAKMQRYFLWLTKQAEEAVYQQFCNTLQKEISMDEFFKIVIENQDVKKLLQDMVLTALANQDWQQIMMTSLKKMELPVAVEYY